MVDMLMTNNKGYYDFEIKNGEIVKTNGFETSIILSLLTDRRASSGEVPPIELRRGWWGNIILRSLNNQQELELGSKIWLTYQERNDETTRNFIRNYINEALIWLVEYGYVKSIVSEITKIEERKVGVKITIVFDNNLRLESIFEFNLSP